MKGETKELQEAEQAQIDIWKYVFGFTSMAVVKCAIDIGIADALEKRNGPTPLSDLAVELRCSTHALYRIIRFLMHQKFFKEEITGEGQKGYVHTPLSRLLVKKSGNSMSDFVLFEASSTMLAPWLRLSSQVVLADETSAFEAVHGEDVWSYALANPAHSKLIDDAMACDARLSVPAVVRGYPEVFEGVGSLVDVGGGNGTTLRELIKLCPWIRGINYDRPHVVAVAPKCEGIEHVGGDMFQSVPKADAAIIKVCCLIRFSLCLQYQFKLTEKILKNCIESVSKEWGKVIILEAILEDDEEREKNNYKEVGLMLDMVLMAHTKTGKERSMKEWDYILNEAGFSRYIVKHMEAVQSIIVAYP